MKRAVLLTAYNRPSYLAEALNTWRRVRGLDDWRFVVSFEPSELLDAQIALVRDRLPEAEIWVQPALQGVLHHPWVGFERLFADGVDFVVRAEDDLLVSEDVLEFFAWAAEHYAKDSQIAAVRAFSSERDGDLAAVYRTRHFSPLTWGTWRDWWTTLIGPTWDHDYSTATGPHDGGWDWNLNTRVLPAHGLLCIEPRVSRVQNIGLFGTHSTAANFAQAPGFEIERAPQPFFEQADSGLRD